MPDPVITADPAPAAAWHAGVDAETMGYIQTQAWHDKPANEVALAAIKAAREATIYNGVPADRLLKLPENTADEAGWKAVHSRLGVPAEAKDYDFSSIKGEDGKPLLDDGEADFMRATAHRLNIPKDTAVQLVQELLKRDAGSSATEAAEKTAKLVEEHAALDKNWGTNKASNLFLAQKGAEKLGFAPEHIQALENVVGYAKIMDALRAVGELAGEARYVGNGSPNNFNNGMMTAEQASGRLAELKRDTAWVARYNAGDTAAFREMQALLVATTGDAGDYRR